MSTQTATVRRRLKAPAALLFETVVDPARFATVRGIRSVEVLRAGDDGPMSVGTLRRVNLFGGYLVEEIVALEPGRRFDYLLRDAVVPFEHRFGRIEFLDRGDHTEAIWTSSLAFGVPLLGSVLGVGAEIAMQLGFRVALGEIDRAAR